MKIDLDAIEKQPTISAQQATALRKKLRYLKDQEGGIHGTQSRIVAILTEKEIEK